MLPEFQNVTIDGREELVMNATAVVELARVVDTAAARRFLLVYHEAENEMAAEHPFLSEDVIRARAVRRALEVCGAVLVQV